MKAIHPNNRLFTGRQRAPPKKRRDVGRYVDVLQKADKVRQKKKREKASPAMANQGWASDSENHHGIQASVTNTDRESLKANKGGGKYRGIHKRRDPEINTP